MAINVKLDIDGKDYYVVAITKGYDGINQFFDFDLTLNNSSAGEVSNVSVHQLATLTIEDDVAVRTLTYECQITACRQNLIERSKSQPASEQEIHINLRPKDWSELKHGAVRIFEVEKTTDNALNESFLAVPTLDELERFLNQVGFEADGGFLEFSNSSVLNDFSMDWWQNQLLFQLEESNAHALKRIVSKMSGAFFYSASQVTPKWLVVPEQFTVSVNAIEFDETKISKLGTRNFTRARQRRYYRDQLSQVNNLIDPNDGLSESVPNDSVIFQELSAHTHIPLSCDEVYEYKPTRHGHSAFTFIPRRVNHVYDHRTGYVCRARGRLANDESWDLRSIGRPSRPMTGTVGATIASESSNTNFGDRDDKMRFFVRFNFTAFDTVSVSTTAWLYRMRENTSANNAGYYHPLPIGARVVVGFLHGDREQPIIQGTLVTKYGTITA